jgi:REase_AHJR-like
MLPDITTMHAGVPEEVPSWVQSVWDARHWLATEYRKQGFDIIEYPTASDVPEELTSYHMDMVARSATLSIAVVIRRRNDLSENISALAGALENRTDWQMSLVVLPVTQKTIPQPKMAVI